MIRIYRCNKKLIKESYEKRLSKTRLILVGAVTTVIFSGCSESVYHLMRALQGVN